ncbi:hypothetical protein HDU92_007952, partial [Lobulomyces angularis]
AHHQSTGFSSTIHQFFGQTLLMGSLTKICLTYFSKNNKEKKKLNKFYKNKPKTTDGINSSGGNGDGGWKKLQNLLNILSSFFFILSGVIFMASNEKSTNKVQTLVDATAFINVLIGFSMLILALVFFFVVVTFKLDQLDNLESNGVDDYSDTEYQNLNDMEI